jgi:hypothetical protein
VSPDSRPLSSLAAPSPAAPPAPPYGTFSITVPDKPLGEKRIKVNLPDGQTMLVVVPPHVPAGARLDVPLPKPLPAKGAKTAPKPPITTSFPRPGPVRIPKLGETLDKDTLCASPCFAPPGARGL